MRLMRRPPRERFSRCRVGSMLPPETMTAVGPKSSTLPARSAAMPTAPAPSTVIALLARGMADAGGDLVFGQKHDVVEQIAAHARRSAVCRDRCRRRANPPASHSSRIATGLPAARLACMAAPRSIEMPMTRVCGFKALTAAAMPPARPPPESGTSTVARSGQGILDDFEADRALTGDDARIVERRDQGEAMLSDQAFDFLLCVVLRCVRQCGFRRRACGSLRPCWPERAMTCRRWRETPSSRAAYATARP